MKIFKKTSRVLFFVHPLIMTFLVLLFSSTAYLIITNDYTRDRDMKVIITDHVRGKYNQMYLIVQNSEWGRFNVKVSPSTYSLPSGSHITLSLSEEDIRPTKSKLMLYVVLQGALIILSGLFILIGIIYYINPNLFQDEKIGGAQVSSVSIAAMTTLIR